MTVNLKQALRKTWPLMVLSAVAAFAMASVHAGATEPRQVLEAVERGQAGSVSDDVQRYCTSFADAARDRRYELKRIELEKLEADVEKRIAAMEEKRAELEAWFKKREEFASKAEASLVGIYKNMRPDAAAARMEELGPDLVAALLLKLPERAAGVILNEMNVEKAALVTNVMVAAAEQETQ